MLDDQLRSQLAQYLAHLKGPIELRAALDESEASREVATLLEEIRGESQLVSITTEVTPGVRVPSFAVARPGHPSRVRFAGLPLGHEFTSLVLALLHVSGHPPKVSAEALDQVRELN